MESSIPDHREHPSGRIHRELPSPSVRVSVGDLGQNASGPRRPFPISHTASGITPLLFNCSHVSCRCFIVGSVFLQQNTAAVTLAPLFLPTAHLLPTCLMISPQFHLVRPLGCHQKILPRPSVWKAIAHVIGTTPFPTALRRLSTPDIGPSAIP